MKNHLKWLLNVKVTNVVFGWGCGFEGLNLRLFVSKDGVVWIKRKIIWFEWI